MQQTLDRNLSAARPTGRKTLNLPSPLVCKLGISDDSQLRQIRNQGNALFQKTILNPALLSSSVSSMDSLQAATATTNYEGATQPPNFCEHPVVAKQPQKKTDHQQKEKLYNRYKRYREAHKEKIAEKQKQYRREHKEKLSEIQKRYQAKHKEKIAERRRQARANKKKKALELNKAP